MVRRQNCSENSATLYIQICYGISGAHFCAASVVMVSYFRHFSCGTTKTSIQTTSYSTIVVGVLVVTQGSKFIIGPFSSQNNITMTFPTDTLELPLPPPPPPPRVCHKAPIHRLPLEFRFQIVDSGSIRRDNLQQEVLTSSAALVQQTIDACFPRLRGSFQHLWTQRRQSLQKPSFLTTVLTLPLLKHRVQHNSFAVTQQSQRISSLSRLMSEASLQCKCCSCLSFFNPSYPQSNSSRIHISGTTLRANVRDRKSVVRIPQPTVSLLIVSTARILCHFRIDFVLPSIERKRD